MALIVDSETWLQGCDLYLDHKQKCQNQHASFDKCKSCENKDYPSSTYLLSSAYDILLRDYGYSLTVDRSVSEVQQVLTVRGILEKKMKGGRV